MIDLRTGNKEIHQDLIFIRSIVKNFSKSFVTSSRIVSVKTSAKCDQASAIIKAQGRIKFRKRVVPKLKVF